MQNTAGEVKMNSYVTFSDGPLHTNLPVLGDQQELTYKSSVQSLDVIWKQWMVWMNGERKSRKSGPAAQLDDHYYQSIKDEFCENLLMSKIF